MKEKYILAGVIIVAVLTVGAVAYRSAYKGDMLQNPYANQKKEVPLALQNAAIENNYLTQSIVTYTAAGFSPTPLTIKIGGTVVFKNESQNAMWVASAPHPAHTDYPEFDALNAIAPGGVYSFTFKKIGTWKYHNHMNATQYGSIVVTE